ncbi:MAG: hypothetical protein FJ149_12815 [Euryarchaeota archaeon]|nr:hypothetical protein [Euryarchaeota archaeon]
MAIAISNNPKVAPADFWQLLEPLDVTQSVLNRLDRAAVEATPVGQRELFLSRYFAACVTGMARAAGILEVYERSGLVVLGPEDDRKRPPEAPESSPYTKNIPALRHLERDIPAFASDYLEILQSRLGMLLKIKHLLPEVDSDEDDLKNRIYRSQTSISVERLYGETRAATAEFLQRMLNRGDPALIPVLSARGAPFIFMWHISLGLLDEMVDALLRGSPLIKKGAEQAKPGCKDLLARGDGIDPSLFSENADNN